MAPTTPICDARMTDDLLLPFENKHIRGEYRRYFLAKRNNYFATIQEFPALWDCYLLLDEIWIREFSDAEQLSDTRQFLPIQLFLRSHAQFRVSFELGFATCIGEAWNTARSAIDSAVRAHKMFREPKLGIVWLDKENGKAEQKAFHKAFEENKKESLFPIVHGLGDLHEYYVMFSEAGTHPTLTAVSMSSS